MRTGFLNFCIELGIIISNKILLRKKLRNNMQLLLLSVIFMCYNAVCFGDLYLFPPETDTNKENEVNIDEKTHGLDHTQPLMLSTSGALHYFRSFVASLLVKS